MTHGRWTLVCIFIFVAFVAGVLADWHGILSEDPSSEFGPWLTGKKQ